MVTLRETSESKGEKREERESNQKWVNLRKLIRKGGNM